MGLGEQPASTSFVDDLGGCQTWCTHWEALHLNPLTRGLAEGERVSFSIGQGLYTIHGHFRKLHSPEVGSAPMQCSAMARWQPLNFQASQCAYLEHVTLMLDPQARARALLLRRVTD